MPRILSAAIATSIGFAAFANAPAATVETVDLVIRNVTVIDPASRKVLKHRDLVIDDGRIVAMTASGGRVRPAVQVVDGTGKFAIPGLIDMHSHTSLRPVHQSSLLMYHANGVTGVREMGSDCQRPGGIPMCIDEMRQSAAAIDAGTMPGPRLLALSTMKVQTLGGPADTADPRSIFFPRNAAEGAATATHLLARKPDIIKIGDALDPGAYGALLDAAGKAGIEASGHIPVSLSVADVARMGQRSIEHARDLPLDCSTYGASFRKTMKAGLPDKPAPGDAPMQRAIKAVATQDKVVCRAQITAMKTFGTFYVPTHLTRAMDYRAGDPAYRADPRLEYIPQPLVQMWTRDLDRTAKATSEEVAGAKAFYELGLRLTGEAHRAGVKIMAGTDSNDTMIFPGFSLHDELVNLVTAGLSPMDALRAATTIPAEYLRRTADFGALAPGRMADIVLLGANPLVNIANTTRIEWVIQGGRASDRKQLDAELAQAKAIARAVPGRPG